MKKVIRTAAMVALMFATATGMANDEKLTLNANADTKSFVYELDSTSGASTITLVDEENHVIYAESLNGGAFAKRFDMKNLNDGLYYFRSEDALRTISYTIQVDGKVLNVLSKKEKAKPLFRTVNQMMYLNLLNLSKKTVKIEIYDSSDRLVFSENRENEMIIEKVLNFKKAFKDEYTVVVKDSENTYYKNIVVK